MVKRFLTILIMCLMLIGSECIPCASSEGGGDSIEDELLLYRANRNRIYEFLIEELGLNHAAVCGIIANIHVESRFNPRALGDWGTSYGICQWHNKRFALLISWSEENGLDYTQLETQLQFMKFELENKYRFVYEHLLKASNTQRGAYSIGNYWCIYYEKPKNKYASGDARGELARKRYWFELNEADGED